jgi:hypothetical protein
MQLSPDVRAPGQLDIQERLGHEDVLGVPNGVRSGQRQMTEREAWEYLAVAWEQAKPDFEGDYTAKVGSEEAIGLCGSFTLLRMHHLISLDTKYAMMEKIQAQRSKLLEGTNFTDYVKAAMYRYLWPRTLDGAKARAEFCRRCAND